MILKQSSPIIEKEEYNDSSPYIASEPKSIVCKLSSAIDNRIRVIIHSRILEGLS